jgi:hypothetical protein
MGRTLQDMTTILTALTVTVIFAVVLLLAVVRAGIRQQDHVGSLTRRPRGLSAAITRRVCCLHARLPERAAQPTDPADPLGPPRRTG